MCVCACVCVSNSVWFGLQQRPSRIPIYSPQLDVHCSLGSRRNLPRLSHSALSQYEQKYCRTLCFWMFNSIEVTFSLIPFDTKTIPEAPLPREQQDLKSCPHLVSFFCFSGCFIYCTLVFLKVWRLSLQGKKNIWNYWFGNYIMICWPSNFFLLGFTPTH